MPEHGSANGSVDADVVRIVRSTSPLVAVGRPLIPAVLAAFAVDFGTTSLFGTTSPSVRRPRAVHPPGFIDSAARFHPAEFPTGVR